jgi:hypothetical protein
MSRDLALAFILLLVALTCRRDQPTGIDEEIAAIRGAVVPPGGAIRSSSTEEARYSRTETWLVSRPRHDWPTYSRWVKKALPDYTVRPSADDVLILLRSFEADSISLEIRPAAEAPFEITVVVIARAF